MEKKLFHNYQSHVTWQAWSPLVATVTWLIASWGLAVSLLQNCIWHNWCCHPVSNYPPCSTNFLPITKVSCLACMKVCVIVLDKIYRVLMWSRQNCLKFLILIEYLEIEGSFTSTLLIFGKLVSFFLPS